MSKPYSISKEGSDQALQDLNVIIMNAATPAVSFPKKRKKPPREKPHPNFDRECLHLKQEMKHMAKLLQKQPFHMGLREKFFSIKRKYRSCLKAKSKHYHDNLLTQLQQLETKDPKEYWHIIKQIRAFTDDKCGKCPEPDPEQLFTHYTNLNAETENINLTTQTMDELTKAERESLPLTC
jgi:hypothetical protein